ncbi:MAG: class I adenylate-forming enzyme family protein, partial [Gammaproteobacteria bacterium]
MQTIRQCIEHHSNERADKIFLIAPDTDQELSFGKLKANVDEIGRHLDQMGIAKGAKIAFLLNNGFWTAQLFLGVMANNRVIVPLNAVAGSTQLQHVLSHSDAEVVVVAPEYKQKLQELMT